MPGAVLNDELLIVLNQGKAEEHQMRDDLLTNVQRVEDAIDFYY